MSEQNLTHAHIGDLKIQPVYAADRLEVALRGSAEPESVAELGRYLQAVAAEAARLKLPLLVLDVRELGFISSSGLKAMVVLLSETQKAGQRVRFRSQPSHHWQSVSLAALASFARNTVEIVVD